MSYIDPLQHAPLYDVVQTHKAEVFAGLRVCLPATITAVNANGTVDVMPAVKQTQPQVGNAAGQSSNYPLLPSCPVFSLQGGGVGAVMPIAVGDMCLVVFADRCLDNWKINGTPAPLPSFRMHTLSDGIVLVGLNSLANPLNTPLDAGEGGLCETKNAFGVKVAINPLTHKVTVQNGTENLAITLGDLVTAITNLNTALGILNTAIAGESATIQAAAATALGNEAAIIVVTTELAAVTTALGALLY